MSSFDPQQPDSNRPEEPRLLTRTPREAEELDPLNLDPTGQSTILPVPELIDATPSAPPPPPARRKPGLLLRITGLIFPVLVVLAIAGFFTARHYLRTAARESLPQIDGTLHADGLAAPVAVLRDAHGVPTIRAVSLDDLLFAQGYVTAQDRLWQMDMIRRHASGRLAELLGAGFVAHDRAQRLLSLAPAADAAVAALPADQLHMLQSYARGVNASIAAQLPHLPVEFHILRYAPDPWMPRDSLLVALAMYQDLTTTFSGKLSREAIAAKLRPELLADLYPVGSWRDHPPSLPPVDLTQPGLPFEDIPLDESQSKLRHSDLLDPARIHGLLEAQATLAQLSTRLCCEGCTPGSNNWAVSGSRTASGKPLLSNDMHLALSVPGIWYEAALEAPGIHAAGVTLPGMPYIIVGHNDHVAWSFTNMGADVQDLAIEHIRNSGAAAEYQAADGVWRPLLHRSEVIHVHHADDITLDVTLTRHGPFTSPIISPIFPHEKRSLSLRWTVYDPAALTIPFFSINTASTGDALVAAFSAWGGPAQNLIYADDAGHIGYHAIGRIPIRGPNPPLTPVPAGSAPSDTPATSAAAIPAVSITASIGSPLSPTPVDATDVSQQWSGTVIPYDSLPHAADPADGVLATANARITPGGYPYQITLDWGAPYRNERIWKVLTTKTNLTSADMLALQRDTYSDLDRTIAQRLAYAIDHAANIPRTLNPKRTRQAADLLRTWDGNVDAGSPAPAIVAAARTALWRLILQPQLGELASTYEWGEKSFAEEQLILHQPARWLPSRFKTWDDLLAVAVDQGLVDAHASSDLRNWTFGKSHPLDVHHPIFSASPLLQAIFGMPTGPALHPHSGDTTTVKQLGLSFGPSERFTADLSNLDNSTLNLVLGQSGNPASPYFLDQWPIWSDDKPADNATLPLPFTSAAVNKAAAHTLTLVPR